MRPQDRLEPGTFRIAIQGTHYEPNDHTYRSVMTSLRTMLNANGFIVMVYPDSPEVFTPARDKAELQRGREEETKRAVAQAVWRQEQFQTERERLKVARELVAQKRAKLEAEASALLKGLPAANVIAETTSSDGVSPVGGIVRDDPQDRDVFHDIADILLTGISEGPDDPGTAKKRSTTKKVTRKKAKKTAKKRTTKRK